MKKYLFIFVLIHSLMAQDKPLSDEQILSLIVVNHDGDSEKSIKGKAMLISMGDSIYPILCKDLLKCNDGFREGVIIDVFLDGKGNKEEPIRAISALIPKYEKSTEFSDFQFKNYLIHQKADLLHQQEKYVKSKLSATTLRSDTRTTKEADVSSTYLTKKTVIESSSSTSSLGWKVAFVFLLVVILWLVKRVFLPQK